MDEYQHPQTGRTYRQGDPAHTYALALTAARHAAEAFLHETATFADADYLTRHEQRNEQVAYRLRDALDYLFHASRGVLLDRHRREAPDAEWRRRYGRLGAVETP